MKKAFLIIAGIFLIACSNKTDTLTSMIDLSYIPKDISDRYDVDQRLEIYKKWLDADPTIPKPARYFDSLNYISLFPVNMNIRDVFTLEDIDNVYEKSNPADRNKFAMYSLRSFSGTYYLLLFNKGEFNVIYLGYYEESILDIFKYFKAHPDLDERLLPLCIQVATKLYVVNMRTFMPAGPWRRWWGEEADSLGRVYNQYLLF